MEVHVSETTEIISLDIVCINNKQELCVSSIIIYQCCSSVFHFHSKLNKSSENFHNFFIKKNTTDINESYLFFSVSVWAHRQTDWSEVTEEVRREGPSDASRWSDRGREKRSGEDGNQDDESKCLWAALKALISLYILSASARPPYAKPCGRGDNQ